MTGGQLCVAAIGLALGWLWGTVCGDYEVRPAVFVAGIAVLALLAFGAAVAVAP